MKKPDAPPVTLKFQPGQAVTVWHGNDAIYRCTVAVSNAKGIELTDGSRWNVGGWRHRHPGALSAPSGHLRETDIAQETAHTIDKRILWEKLPPSVLEAVRAVLEDAQAWPIKDCASPVAGTVLGAKVREDMDQMLMWVVHSHLPHASYLVFTRANDASGAVIACGLASTKKEANAMALRGTGAAPLPTGFYGTREDTTYTIWQGGKSSPLLSVNITAPPGAEKA